MKNVFRNLVLFSAACGLAAGCQKLKPTEGGGSGSFSGKKVKVEMYVMSKCPFGKQAEDGFAPVIAEMGDAVEFQLDFIASESDGQFSALHGEPEVKGNILQLCAIKHHPDAKQYVKFVECQNKNMQSIPDGWEACAKEAGLDQAKISSCYAGEEGKQLLRESIKRSTDRGARGSPTIFVAGEPYQGGRSKTDFMRAICAKYDGAKPEACSKIPEPVQVNAVVLSDKRCEQCNTTAIINSLRGRFFPKLEVKEVDYASDEGKALYKEVEAKLLPVILFQEGVEKADQYAQIERWMMPKGKYKMLRIPANFDPTAEICDNKSDDTGDGKIDCDDATCKEQLVCRQEKPNQVEVFVMSQCPFGVRAIDAMKEVLGNFGGKLKFDVHYIANEAPKGPDAPRGFSALHGPPEVDENIRQLCAKKYYGKNNKYLDYIWCRNKDYRSAEWKQCASGGIAANVIEKCATGPEGEALHREDIKIAAALQVNGSPTWLGNNRYKFSGIDANTIKKEICKTNKALPNCDKELTGQSATAAPSGSCGS